MNMLLYLIIVTVMTVTLVEASPAVKPYYGRPTQAEIDAKLAREKEALPPYPVIEPHKLWKEGETLFTQKQYGEGIILMRASLKAEADVQKADILAKYEADLKQKKNKANGMRRQGKMWQERGNISKAVALYQSSLVLWPDALLELHIKDLNSPESIKSNLEIVEMTPCDILDISAFKVPADFSLKYAPGTDASDRRTVSSEELFADGRLVRYSRSRITYTRQGPPQYQTAPKRVPEMAVQQLYAATQACAFNKLKGHRKKNDSNKWGTPWTFTLTVDGKQHAVGVLRAYVSRFEYVRTLFTKTIEGY